MMPRAAHLSASSGSGYLVVTSTRRSPTFLISFTETKLLCMFEPGPLARFSENTTSSAVSGEPSWNFTSGRMSKNQVVGSRLAPLVGQRRLELEVLVAPDQRIVDVGGEGQEEGLLTGVRVHRADIARIGPFEGLGLGRRRHAETGAGDRRQRKRMPQTESSSCYPFVAPHPCRADRSPRPWSYALTHTYPRCTGCAMASIAQIFCMGYIRWTSPAGGRYRRALGYFFSGCGHE